MAYYYFFITIIIVITIIIIIIIVIELTNSKTILENTIEIEPQPVALYFENLSKYSSRSKLLLLLLKIIILSWVVRFTRSFKPFKIT